jgi:DNA repair photolyase
MQIKEIRAKNILTRSRIPETDYCINPYVGCLHACVYCYASFMRRFTGHQEDWGKFLDVKINVIIPS